MKFACAIIILISSLQILLLPTNSDAAFLSTAAARLASGAVPYRDFYFEDLPALLWLYLPSVFAGAKIYTAACLLGFSALLILVARKSRAHSTEIVALLAGQLICGYVCSSYQHLLYLSAMPLMLVICRRAQGPLALLSVFLFALFAAASLYFMPLVAVLVIYLLTTRRYALSIMALLALSVDAASLWLCSGSGALYNWIWPLKCAAWQLHDMAIYGIGTAPDRRDLLYWLCLAIVIAAATAGRLRPLMRIALVAALYGFIVFLCSQSQLSVYAAFCASMLTVFFILLLSRLALSSLSSFSSTTSSKSLSSNSSRTALSSSLFPTMLAVLLCAPAALDWWRVSQAVTTGGNAPDLAHSIKEHSKPGDRVLLLSGRSIPQSPLASALGRLSPRYFIDSAPFGYLQTLAGRDKDLKERLMQKLKSDLVDCALIAVEDGPMVKLLNDGNVLSAGFHQVGEGRYYSPNCGEREYADFNYVYQIYVNNRSGDEPSHE